MQPEEIKLELIKAVDGQNGLQALQHLMLKLKKEDSDIVLNELLEIFFLSNSYPYQAAAGGLLWKLKPKYRRNLREDITNSLKNWNVSVEELPWYFASVKGLENVIEEVKSILEIPLSEIEKSKAKTYLYWLSAGNPEGVIAELNNSWNGRLRG